MVLTVELENNVWSFYPGQIISGRVVVTKNIWHKVEGLSIRFLGKMEFGCAASAPVLPPQDTTPHSQPQESLFERITRIRPTHEVVLDHKENLIFNCKEQFTNHSILFLNWKMNSKLLISPTGKVLKPGSHTFPFTFNLPDDANLPDSLNIDGFRIVYEFIVVLRRPRDDFKVYQTQFYIQSKLDDQSAPHTVSIYSSNFEQKTEDSLGWCWCFKSGPYTMLFRVPKRIALVGSDVDFVFEIWNDTNVNMDRAKVRLVREFKHKRGLDTKKKEIVSELAGPTVTSNEHKVWTTYFRIPENTPPTNFVRRETYEINYYLKALIHPLNRENKSISVKCPLLIIKGVETEMPVLGAPSICEVAEEDNFCIDGRGLPPTYEEAVSMDNNSGSPLLE
ncbi:Arrestin domain-containing protein 4 [Orchesella cincta]|uniref:Arrestin domain-containing protein 4 n=1 Tax=Orchesella cincta TaxID=48709 RepID=A0A1D2NFH6_ORCCI|nr:Arrestin domain-containing protein 4 [Orchesella cincta]